MLRAELKKIFLVIVVNIRLFILNTGIFTNSGRNTLSNIPLLHVNVKPQFKPTLF